MKRLFLTVFAIVVLMPGCATISHKDVSTKWQGYGINLEYQSRVSIPPDLIPEFIDAVDRLEKFLQKSEIVTIE